MLSAANITKLAMNIRQARPSDAEAIGAIRVAAWQAGYQKFLPADFLQSLDPKANLEKLKSSLLLQSQTFTVLVSEDSVGVNGFAILGTPRYETSAGAIELYALNINPNSWGRGLGSALVRASIDSAKSYGATLVELWCIDENFAARELYKKCGFQETDRIRTTTELTGHPLRECCFRILCG